jgi:hypothetical protein
MTDATAKQATKPSALERRAFLKTAGLGAGVAVGAAMGVALDSGPVEAAENERDRRKQRYRDSEHIQTFYRLNRD